jgi:hypothetical protein
VDERAFWEIIETSGSPEKCSVDEQCENIVEKLSSRTKEELISFANIHKEVLHKAYTWPMLKASFIVTSYISDDVFEDFRNWVILNGKERFYKTIEHPDFISSYINVEDPVEEVTGEALLFVCEEAWDGDIEELEDGYVYPKDPVIDDDWPSKEKLEEEFPKLYGKFWDDENVRTLNS